MRQGSFLIAISILCLGGMVAWLFRQPSQEIATPKPEGTAAPTQTLGSRRTTAIVPLSIGSESTTAGETKLEPKLDDQGQVGVDRIPEIRRSPNQQSTPALPQLTTSYQRPLAILGLSEATAIPSSPSVEVNKPVVPATKPTPIQHTIVDGDTLASIAKQYLGNAQRTEEIFLHNQEVLTDPQLLPIGVTIEIVKTPGFDSKELSQTND